jgi:hypothetical protein
MLRDSANIQEIEAAADPNGKRAGDIVSSLFHLQDAENVFHYSCHADTPDVDIDEGVKVRLCRRQVTVGLGFVKCGCRGSVT